jgi:anti-sigma factor RsiW
VQWLSKRLHRQLKVPNLSAAGFELVGGRLLPGDQGARAQFMYQNAAGERITLYVGAVEGAGVKGMDETAFRYTSEAGIASFYWVDQGFGYALSGKLPRQGLLTLAEAVYKQL